MAIRPHPPLNRPPFLLAAVLALAPTLAAAAPTVVQLPWSTHGATAQARFGAVVAPAGDVNGDGYSDVLVSAPKDEGPAADAGKVFLYLGSAAGLATVPAWSWSANFAGGASGTAAAAAGDVNGDGYADIVIGTPQWTEAGLTLAGKISIFNGGPTGLPATPTYERVAPTPTAGAQFGAAVGTAGDVNGDGYDDVIVGAPFHTQGGISARGGAFIYHGGAAGLAATPARTLLGMNTGARFGRSVSTAGDIDADGYADIIVGAPHNTVAGLDGGTATVLRGSASGVALPPDTVLVGTQAGEEAGFSVANAGDVDGDGYADVLVGHPGYSNGGLNMGGYELFRGGPGGHMTGPEVAVYLTNEGARLGATVATLGDLNADGYADFGAAAPGDSTATPDPRVYVQFGGPLPLAPYVELSGPGVPVHFGSSLATAGDVDGDGFAEFVVGDPGASVVPAAAEGTASLFKLGRSVPVPMPDWPVFSGQTGTFFGAAVAFSPGPDVQGFPRLLVAEPGYDIGGPDYGIVYGYPGYRNGVDFGTFGILVGETSGDKFGSPMADVGDIDRDGYTDMLVSSPTRSAGGSETGRVSLVRGAQGGALQPVTLLEGDQSFEHLGSAVAGRGDVDGDGYHDLLIGAPQWDGPGLADCGKVWLYYGGPTGLRASPWTAQGTVAGQGFGASLAIGDIDADGFGDVLIGSVSPLAVSPPAGKVEVHYGSAAGASAAAAWTVTGNTPSPTFGTALAAVGDVNGDGVSDFAVGDPATNGAGRAYVYTGGRGRGLPPPPFVYDGTQAGAAFGASVAGGGDVDGDGVGDFIVGEPLYDGGQTDEGRLNLFYGNHGKPVPGWTVESNSAQMRLGSSLARLVDVNDDGFADIAAGAPGMAGVTGGAYAFAGGGAVGVTRSLPLQKDLSSNPYLYYPVRVASDQTVAVSALVRSAEGRAHVRFQIEAALLDQPFTGVPTQVTPPIDTGPSTGSGSAGGVFSQLTLPWQTGAYKVRARTLSRSPFFPDSRWIRPEAQAEGELDVMRGGTVAVEGTPAALIAPRLARIAPNPLAAASGAARIGYDLPRAARVTLELYDVRGALLRRLVDETRPAGASSATWDGRDERGRSAPAGLYFVRLLADGQESVGRLVRVR